MSRAALLSSHPTSYVDLGAAGGKDGGGATGRRAVIDVAGTGAVSLLPVLLVPGFTGSKEDFGPVLDGLSAAGHRVVALDLAGQWESEGPAEPSSYSPEILASELPQVLAALGIGRAHLVGHSYGGLVSRAAVLAGPAPWASLTLLCSGPSALAGSRRDVTELLAAAAEQMTLPDLYDAMLAYWASHNETMPTAQGAAFQRDRFVTSSPAALIGMAAGLLGEPDRVEELAAVCASSRLPLSVVFGSADDAWTPPEQADMAARLGVTPIVIEGAGHSPAYEAPEETVRVLVALLA